MVKFLRGFQKYPQKIWLLFALSLATMILVLVSASMTQHLILVSDFETQNFSEWKQDLCCKYSGEIVTSPTRAGKYAAKFTLNKNDPLVSDGKRAELKRYTLTPMGSEYWYAFSIYLPRNWIEDTAPEIVAQWHDLPDFWLGENWRNPSLSLSINRKDWKIGNAWDSQFVTKKNNAVSRELLWSGAFERGGWTDWVFHVKWSYKSDGLVEVWKDNTLVVNKRGPNTYNDLIVPYLKIGPYKYPWKKGKPASIVNERVIYYDEVRIGNAHATFADVIPGS